MMVKSEVGGTLDLKENKLYGKYRKRRANLYEGQRSENRVCSEKHKEFTRLAWRVSGQQEVTRREVSKGQITKSNQT